MGKMTRTHWNLLIFLSAFVAINVLTACIVKGALAPSSSETQETSRCVKCSGNYSISDNTSDGVRNNGLVRKITVRSSEDRDLPKPSYRLVTSVIPHKYFLTILPILESGYEKTLGEQWFAPGSVLIDVEAVKATNTITLHAKNITIHNVTVEHKSTSIPIQNISLHARHSFLIIHLDHSLIPGDVYKINITFTSYISQVLNGLFRSNYINPDTGKMEWFAATHMEALHCRQMYPSFDEPSYKAIIQAKVGRMDDYVVLFNTESIANETMHGVFGWVWETFAPTVPMSTYLTALVIAKFQYSEAPGKLLPNTRVRTYASPHYVQQGAAVYASEVSERILKAYGDYFGESYPMTKFDTVAVPHFFYGAMENYGLSIFRENLLLNFPNHSTEAQRYIVTNVISHELGHQWFGNLVSPNWWTHLWISEGLTKFIEYIALNATIPEFQPWDIFLSESLQFGLRLDSDPKTSHSLKIDEDSWPQKNEMEWFDDIAYKKGGSLIRMMQGFLTEPVLRKGLSTYLKRMKYKAAVQDDLFLDCDKEGQLAHKLPENVTLKLIMSDWTLKSGFPLLKVNLKASNAIVVSQEKYSTTRANMNPKKYKWFVPVSVATEKHPNFDPEPEFWIRNNESSVTISLHEDSWVILNAGTTGFYRVIYDDELTNRITNQLMEYPLKIDKLSRSQLMDDYFNSAWNRYLPIQRALNLTKYMKQHAETEHVVWNSLLTMMKIAYRIFKDSNDDFSPFKAYMLPRIENAIKATGGYGAINISSVGLPVIRHAQLIDWACNMESIECIDYATNLVESWRKTGQMLIPKDFRVVILSTAIAHDIQGDLYNFILDKYQTQIGGKTRDQLLTALANTRDVANINRLLESAVEHGPMIDPSDANTVLQHLASNSVATEIILKYFTENFDAVVNHFGSIQPIVQTANAMAPHLRSLSGLFLIEKLVQTNEAVLKTSLSAAISRIRANIIWFDDFGEDMIDFFKHNK